MAATGVAAGTSGQATQSMPKLKFVKRRITHGPSDLLRCVCKIIYINSLPQADGMQLKCSREELKEMVDRGYIVKGVMDDLTSGRKPSDENLALASSTYSSTVEELASPFYGVGRSGKGT